MNNLFFKSLQFSLAVLDILTINTVFFTAEFLFRNQIPQSAQPQYIYFIFFLNIVWLAVALMKGIYHERNIGTFEQYSKVSMQAYVYLLLVVMVTLFFFRMVLLSRLFIIVVLTSLSVALVINRLLY